VDFLWAELINSNWRDHRGTGACEDRIGNDAWLATFLKRAGWKNEHLPDAEDRESLRQMRTFLGQLVECALDGQELTAKHVERLNRALAGSPVIRRLEIKSGMKSTNFEPVDDGIDAILGTVAASFVAVLTEGDPARIKVCANQDCGWVIYDSSRNRTRRWCDKTECGNLIKVREHRLRKRAEARQTKSS
jgi:predicted RNA-binding Zn ribbon-like protein